MKNVLNGLTAFVGRHWLRIAIIGVALFLANRKQLNVNVRLGGDGVVPRTNALANTGGPVTEGEPSYQGKATASLIASLFDGDAPSAPREEAAALAALAPEKPSLLSRLNPFNSSGEAESSVEVPTAAPAPAPPYGNTELYDQLLHTGHQSTEAFVARFAHVAQAEQNKYGIPASIVLANGLLHSQAGQSQSAQGINSYFNIPCGLDWEGDYRRDATQCTRRYETAWLAFRAHSEYITTGRYAPMTQFTPTDYRRWAVGLQELGFNKTPNLAAQLIAIVENNGLTRYDN